jgi:hypothetical protein
MKMTLRVLATVAIAIGALFILAFARELGSREARQKIADAIGFDKVDNVRIKSISTGMGGEAIVEAQIGAAFRLTKGKDDNWTVVEVRTGDRQWESVELVQTAVRKEKTARTVADLKSLASALEQFKRERGSYVQADTGRVLVDNLAPTFLDLIIRLDAWSHEFEYKGTANTYRLSSSGPDGMAGTGDDIIFENGQQIKGAVE